MSERHFRIRMADRVRWEWYYYGRPKIQANRFFLDYWRMKAGIKTDMDVDWYLPAFSVSEKDPAVQIE